MFDGQFVFSQLMDFLPRREFNACVDRYGGNDRWRHFSCRDQFLCLAFAQLTFRESLRDVEICLRAWVTSCITLAFAARFRAAPWPMQTVVTIGESMPTSPRC